VLSKKENAHLKTLVKDGSADPTAAGSEQKAAGKNSEDAARKAFTQKQIEQARLQQTCNVQYEREMSYRDAITKLKRMVEVEKK